MICCKGFEGDGYTCKLTVPCWKNPGVCDPNAECVQLPGKQRQPEYGCKCNDGFIGDGFSCQGKFHQLKKLISKNLKLL